MSLVPFEEALHVVEESLISQLLVPLVNQAKCSIRLLS
jgi:hypothetical protein